MNPPGARHPSQPDSPSDPLGPRRRERRAFHLGLGVSLVLHVVLVALYALVGGTAAVSPPVEAAPVARAPEPGIEVIDLAELEEPDEPAELEPPDEPEEPEPEEDPEDEPEPAPAPEVAAAPDTAAAAPTEAEGEDITLAERLQPRMRDARLWAPLEREYTDLTDSERVGLLLRGMIQDWNDSVAVAAALAQEARDWTYTDDEGRRWGLGPGGMIHLGDFAVPIPFAIGVPPGRRDQWMEDQQIRDDLARGAATAAIRETWAERARAIRERLEAERDVGSSSPRSPDPPADGGGGGSP